MHDASDAIIYVGKAVSLRNRVRQYFQACHDEGIKKDQMVKKITRFEYIITDSELEALVLECNLIKEYRPKYNTMLRDDKTYPYIGDSGGRISQGSLLPSAEKRQIQIFWPIYQCRCGERYDRFVEKNLSFKNLQPGIAKRYWKRTSVP